MFRMTIQLNEEKIEQEGKYSLGKMYDFLDEMFQKRGFHQIPDEKYARTYQGTDDYKDFGRLGSIVLYLKNRKWFMSNVAVWLMLESENLEEPLEFFVYDAKRYYKEKEKDIWRKNALRQ